MVGKAGGKLVTSLPLTACLRRTVTVGKAGMTGLKYRLVEKVFENLEEFC